MKFQAAIHGVDLNNPDGKSADSSNVSKNQINNPMLFGDPEEYKKMTPQEKEEATKKMKGYYKHWSNQNILSNVKLKPKGQDNG